MKKIIVAMSGGVDSSVAAWLLKEDGYEVIGVSLKLISNNNRLLSEKKNNRCCSADDVDDARQVCDKIGIPFYVIDASKEFQSRVIDPFIKSYITGKTPNPCLECNKHIKFNYLFNTAKLLNANISTGHYASISYYNDVKTIMRSVDKHKDQSYYLYNTPINILNNLHLPLGKFKKDKIRVIANNIGLKVADKLDSQGICFSFNDYQSFIEQSCKKLSIGNFVDINGKILSTHKGIHYYTVGQRRGLGISFGYKAYVININNKNNEITIGDKKYLECNNFQIKNISIIVSVKLWPKIISLQIRSNNKIEMATWFILENDKIEIKLKNNILSVALGQSAVLYDNNFVLGGGIISSRS